MTFFRKLKPVSTRVEILKRDASKLRLSEFQADEALTSKAGVALADQYVSLMMQVARNESPALYCLRIDATVEERAAYQSKIEGYNMALANLEAMAVHRKFVQTGEPTFESEEQTI
jgi:hypothetical protein